MKKRNYKKLIGSTFVLFEMFMHWYLLYYLIFVNQSNLAVIGFTAFELSMFIFLLVNKEDQPMRGHPNLRNLCDGNHAEDKIIAYKPYQK